jgi:hypothetical protein
VKTTIPKPNTRLRPKTSPRRPPNSMKPPNMSVYIVITHWRPDALKCNPRWIVGSATLTIVASRTTMNCATQTMTITSQGLLLSASRTSCDRLDKRTRHNLSIGAKR